ncbi:DEAD/DEAH box helicase [Cryptosporangium minutisporangium]|uniref:DEAD/DEAH box helicase n=1 Tax=Cryptosporangium minutisporangium TaxID=113569 RepID=A0ABP6T8I5_9ACTN
MSSPAEQYAAARRRAAYPGYTDFTAQLSFDLDDFQREACQALEDGRGVLVCAPTGAGKTVVGEFAVHLALRQGTKCFYTTPIKALSNQKFNDLVARYGADKVGLLTGDNAINGDAPVVVMTTEVLRNMLYAGSATLANLAYVVMDEVHYLADRFRGAVWEEVIIHLPESVSLVSLSATVSNAEEFAEWLVTVRGDTAVVVSEHRPVPLWQHMLVGRRMFDLFTEKASATGQPSHKDVDPELTRYVREQLRRVQFSRSGRPIRAKNLVPYRSDVIERLDREGLLPAITFVFSRAGCDAAVQQCMAAGLRLTTPEERIEIRRIAEERTADLAAEDLQVLGYWEWLDGLQRGLAAHHAGLLPVYKEVVEELFVRGLVKAVFATETLALGINMPARSVVLERLVKFNGETHVDLTAGEYTQLTGRAGRRGIDVEGHAVVVWSPEIDPRHVAGLASTRTYPLRSSFRPSYNMAVNLVGSVGRERARELLETSFAQFQADRAVVGLAKQAQRQNDALDAYLESMTCHLGDFAEYAALRRQIKDRENALAKQGAAQRRAAAADSLERLRIGDVVMVQSGRRAGLAVVLDPGSQPLGEARPLVLTADRWAGRLSLADFPNEVEVLTRMRVPKHFNHRSPQARRDLASSLRTAASDLAAVRKRKGRAAAADDDLLAELRAALRRHPCHGCHDREEHARWAERYDRLAKETHQLEQRVHTRTNSLARTFDQVCGLLESRGYLDGERVTEAGSGLARIWSESDLLVAECLRAGVWDGLSAAELAGAVSALVYEARRADEGPTPVPNGPLRDSLTVIGRLAAELQADEGDRGLALTREPDYGFVWPAYRWARGEPLERVLTAAAGVEGEMPAGDFVRWCRQVLDLLDQIAGAAPAGSDLRSTARQAIDATRRGVVAYTAL